MKHWTLSCSPFSPEKQQNKLLKGKKKQTKKTPTFLACSSHHFHHPDCWWWSAVSIEPLRCVWTTSEGASQMSLAWRSSQSFLLPQLLEVKRFLFPVPLAGPPHTCPPNHPSAASEILQGLWHQPESPCIPKQSDPDPDNDWGLSSLNLNATSGFLSQRSQRHMFCICFLSLYLFLIKGPTVWHYKYLSVCLFAGPSQQWIETGVKRCFREAPDGTWQARPPNTADTVINSVETAKGTLKNTSNKEVVNITSKKQKSTPYIFYIPNNLKMKEKKANFAPSKEADVWSMSASVSWWCCCCCTNSHSVQPAYLCALTNRA